MMDTNEGWAKDAERIYDIVVNHYGTTYGWHGDSLEAMEKARDAHRAEGVAKVAAALSLESARRALAAGADAAGAVAEAQEGGRHGT